MNVAIIGCGFIGKKRAKALKSCRLISCVDIIQERAEEFAHNWPGAEATTDWRAVVDRSDIDVVIIATFHNVLAEIALAALQAGKHVLVEKPAACNVREIDSIITEVAKNKGLIRVGFNHRYHPAFIKAREIVAAGGLGKLMFIRARYGHGGRIKYDQEWRAKKKISGGGELIDQGIHLIDLSRMFLGDFSKVHGIAHTYFWNMNVEDNGFMLLETDSNQVAFMHASWTEWKNTFSFEIYGRDAKIDISGLGGSYGVERLSYYKMLPQMGPPETVIWEYPGPDKSWEWEFAEFIQDISLGRQPTVGLKDARAALEIVEKIYKMSRL